jgi:hypothetical protein
MSGGRRRNVSARRDQQAGGERSPQGRQRQRGRGGSAKGGRSGGRSGGQGQGRRGNAQRRRNRGGRANPQQDPVAFWGDPAGLPASQPDVRITDDPSAVPRSLGAPPLPGHEAIAEHYFRVVFERAVTTAGALAAAGGLIDPDALLEELDD